MRLFTLVLALSITSHCLSQVSGTVIDEEGSPLPYVSIYVKGTTIGTTTNIGGLYDLRLTPGKYELVYQYVGYAQSTKIVTLDNAPLQLDITLLPQATLLNELVIAADAEDPAYAIIREAIKKRDYYKNLNNSYTCDAYVKGNNKILAAPEKIMGVEVGDMDGNLDSNRQGIVYLSESVSKLYVNDGNIKEVVTSSKISGNDNGYSYNSAREMEFSFYENSIELQRQMLSPISDAALNYYNYELIGIYFDDEKRRINKIKVIPKRNADPCFYGTIYITHDLWNIHSLDLGVTAKASQVYVLDSLTFKQVFLPLDESESWALFNNSITFKLGVFGFEMKGIFSCIYSNYDINPTFEDGFFDNVVLEVKESSNERDSAYWERIRPIPLTADEQIDYVVKDSISEARKDPIYLDSMDRKSNKFNFGNILGEYSHIKRSKNAYYSIESPITNLSFNTVQGLNTAIKFNGQKYHDEEETKGIYYGGQVNYGFSEKQVRGNAFITIDPSGQDWSWWHINAGKRIRQFNNEAINPFVNMAYSLLLKENYAKYYDVEYLTLANRFEPSDGVFVRSELSYQNRSSLSNNTDFSFFNRDDIYFTNAPDRISPGNEFFDNHQAFKFNVTADIRFGQKYIKRPDFRFNAGSTGPRLLLSYTGAFEVFGGDVSYHKVAATIRDTWDIGVGGRLDWYLNGGTYFGKNRVEFADYRHFDTYEILFTGDADYRSSFLQLPYYTYSTNETYFQAHLQHHFDGWILDKIPGVNQLGLSMVAGAKYLKAGSLPSYSEFHLGIDNIGFGFIRLIRVDGVMSLSQGETNFGVRLGLALN